MRVHKRVARKDYPAFGIVKGNTYYAWQFKNQPETKSLTYPKPQQLTRSEFEISCFDFSDTLAEIVANFQSATDTSPLEDLLNQIEELRDEQEQKKDNMPESLQNSATAELLQERYDKLDEIYNELESIKDRLTEFEGIVSELEGVSF